MLQEKLWLTRCQHSWHHKHRSWDSERDKRPFRELLKPPASNTLLLSLPVPADQSPEGAKKKQKDTKHCVLSLLQLTRL